ncbi:hypothetical protein M5K25_014688 [Dendrobium thyrsiflorum]|uniref:Uncharacterized protein n=1 Tax=Dendrobium thyrsiflorum TaxID=117978 RepID=A0ABD0UP43_DENTH
MARDARVDTCMMWLEPYHMSTRRGSGAGGSGCGHGAQGAGRCTGRGSEHKGCSGLTAWDAVRQEKICWEVELFFVNSSYLLLYKSRIKDGYGQAIKENSFPSLPLPFPLSLLFSQDQDEEVLLPLDLDLNKIDV